MAKQDCSASTNPLLPLLLRALLLLVYLSLTLSLNLQSEYELNSFYLNSSALSITSFRFNPYPRQIFWIKKMLGKQALFWRITPQQFRKVTRNSSDVLPARARFRFSDEYKRLPPLPPYEDHANCTIEILGYVALHQGYAFKGVHERLKGPSIGNATLSLLNQKKKKNKKNPLHNVACWYRAIYSNRREFDVRGSYWPVVVYCPMMTTQAQLCDILHNKYQKIGAVDYKLTMKLSIHVPIHWSAKISTRYVAPTDTLGLPLGGGAVVQHTWRNNTAYINTTVYPLDQASLDKAAQRQQALLEKAQAEHVAVCTVWPYTTSVPTKEDANKALIFEFLRYYSRLGFKLMVYDRDGANMEGVLDSAYATQQLRADAFSSELISQHLVYHNFTVHGLLRDPRVGARTVQPAEVLAGSIDALESSKSVPGFTGRAVGDMEGMAANQFHYYDDDKDLTYTHCRFEAQSRFGISKVLVVDFDEFLFCPGANNSDAHSQREFMRKTFSRAIRDGKEQLMFDKANIAHKPTRGSARPRIMDCMQGIIDASKAAVHSAATAVKIPHSTTQALIAANLSALSSSLPPDAAAAAVSGQGLYFADDIAGSLSGRTEVHQQKLQQQQEQRDTSTPATFPASIFSCFGSSQYIEEVENVKSLHLNHGCPYTSMHHACSIRENQLHAYDCLCAAMSVPTCKVFHLSLLYRRYSKKKDRNFNNTELAASQLELDNLVHSSL